jgi:hypothetical protein
VERLDENAVPKSRPLWLAWVGIEMPALCTLWRLYLRRFGVDHKVSIGQTTLALDFTQTQYKRTV